jgi:hypothetical protein
VNWATLSSRCTSRIENRTALSSRGIRGQDDFDVLLSVVFGYFMKPSDQTVLDIIVDELSPSKHVAELRHWILIRKPWKKIPPSPPTKTPTIWRPSGLSPYL